MSGPSDYQPSHPALKWLEQRLPIIGLVHSSFIAYPTPRNLNYWWTFGAILSMMLGIQIVTGVVLAMHYTPHADLAFKSVELIVRDVNYGWLLRNMHACGASMFFLAVYIHMFRGLYYGSYKAPREVLWILGVIIYLLMMATGFMGYVLPWGQMSFWGATVITNLFSAVPYFGESIVTLLWGGYSVGNPTLNRFFALHYLLPFLIAGVVVLHVWALHVTGQNNPAGVEPKTEKDMVPFTPYATIKDFFGVACFLIFYSWFIFYMPNYLGEADNYIPANPAVTPAHIVPEWYYLPFYAILRSIPNKLAGVIAMFAAIIVLVFLPWLDSAKTRSNKYRPLGKQFFWIFVVVCIGLGYLGAQPPEGVYVVLGRILTVLYFAYFLIVLPLLARIERPRPLPNSIADDVLARTGRKAAPMVSTVIALVAAVSLLAGSMGDARASEGQENPPSAKWSFAGPFGTFDRGAVQRGLKVYKEVCSNCHSLQYVAFRNLAEPGGPGYSPAQAAAFAAEYKIKDGPNDAGEMFERPGRPADYFPSPFPNEQAARAANGGAAPPDLSLMAKARSYKRGFPWFLIDFFTQFQEQGPNYINALLQGYEETPPHGVAIPDGSYYNKYFPGHAIKMPPPLSDGQVTFDDGSPATVKQYAHDVATFLMWTAEPHMEARKRLGYQVFIFLIIFAGLMYFTKKRVWAAAH
ncbi:cytochrome c1 [Bradyrhizobium sp. SZCCHNS3052]|uniref:cytochrome c1 n=1 Tax=Bradyrhizobium sp. SZCCHNS3052 TaxID=3057321 RepID=UPI00291623D7|nr:cytochrome c1 [Bradyrhizobium sp. SZCCHNS3052]